MNRIDAEVTPGLKTTLDGLRGTIAAADGVLKNTDATLVGKDAPAPAGTARCPAGDRPRGAIAARTADYLERHPESLIRGKTEE